MKRIAVLAVAFALVGFLMADDVYAHGGSFRGPSGGVPPGLREPSDPEPPPPPPSDPGDPGGPVTPGDPNPGPITPPDSGHEATPGEGTGPPAPVAPNSGPSKKATTKTLTYESWRFWWGYNNDDILNIKSHIYSARTSSSSPLFFTSKRDEQNRRNAQRPTERAVMKTIIPALRRSLNRPRDHEDIHGGCLVALGKIGTSAFVPTFDAVLKDTFRNEKDIPVRFGLQATESAALALGLLPNLDQKGKDAVRRVCLETIRNDKLRTRERCWAAVSLGLQKDREAVKDLVELLDPKHEYGDDSSNVLAGILAGLGLIGDPSVVPDLAQAFVEGDLYGRDIKNKDRVRAFVGFALLKIGEPSEEALNAVMKVLKSRSFGRIVKRSATIAAGALASKASDAKKREMVAVLRKYLRKSGGDPSGENFAIISLSQIGSPDAYNALIDIAKSGKYGQRPFAGLGLATQYWYKERDREAKRGEGMDEELKNKIKKTLRECSDKYKDSDTKAAFMLCRGLVQDKSAIDELVRVVSKKSSAPVLRGFCCIALGLIGDAREDVKDSLKLALQERKSTDLRRDAATGLGLLRDAEVGKLLLTELRKAKSFAVQGQLITAIGTIGDHTAIDPLVKLLDDSGQPAQTRAMAAVGLGMIGDLRDIPALSRISKNYNYRASVPDMDELLFIL